MCYGMSGASFVPVKPYRLKMTKTQLSAHPRQLPTDAVVAITYRCNLRCGKCNLWQDTNQEDLDPGLMDRLPPSLHDLNISGGEPFLHNRLVEIVQRALERCPRVHIIISTGGWLMQSELKRLGQMVPFKDKLGLAISIDGLAATHDLERGRPGSYEMAISTLKAAREMGFTDLRLAFTFTSDNITEYQHIRKLAAELGVEVSTAVVHDSKHYFSPTWKKIILDKTPLLKELDTAIQQQIGSVNPKQLARTYFLAGLEYYLRTEHRPLPCFAAEDFFFLTPNGDVMACNMLNLALGNLHKHSFSDIWNSEQAREAVDVARKCQQCWMICSARSSMRHAMGKLAIWAMKAKLGKHRIE